MPILAIMIPYIVWTMIMYAVFIMTYKSGDNHNVAMVKTCKVYMDGYGGPVGVHLNTMILR